MSPISKLKKILNLLPHGSGKTLANKTNKAEVTIRKIAAGEFNNKKVISEAKNMLKSHRKNIDEFFEEE
jgi:hypothetical protein